MTAPRIQLSLSGRPLDDAVLALLTRLEVRESDREAGVAAMRFNVAQRQGGELTPLDDGLFGPAAPLSVQVEAPGGTPVHLFAGYVTHVRPHFEPIESNCYVEVLAMDAAVLLDAEERAASYPDATDGEAVEQVFGRYSISVQAERTPARHAQDRQLLVQRGSDWRFVHRLARRNGFACYLEPDPATGAVTAYFRPPPLSEPPQADLVAQREGQNLRWLDLQYVATGPVGAAGVAIDPLEKRLVRADGATSLDPLGDVLAGVEIERGLTGAGAGGARALLRDPSPLDAAIGAEATGEADRAQFVVQARGELDPALYRGLLRARRPVLVTGVGRSFAGTYYVRAVRTTVDEGELTQTFVAERNAVGLSGRESFGQSAEEVPPQ